MANHQFYNCEKAAAPICYTKQINMTNSHKHKMNAIKTTEDRSKQRLFCFESKQFSWCRNVFLSAKFRQISKHKRTESTVESLTCHDMTRRGGGGGRAGNATCESD